MAARRFLIRSLATPFLAFWLLAGCGSSGPKLLPGDAELRIVLVDLRSGRALASGDVLAPETTYRLDIELRQGGKLTGSLIRGGLPKEWLSIRGEGVSFPPAGVTVTTGPAPLDNPAWRYRILVSLHARPNAAPTVAEYRAELSGQLGPEPQDVAELSFTVSSSTEGGGLNPGETGKVSMRVRDRAGREYSSDIPVLRKPLADRMRIGGEGIKFDPGEWTVTLVRSAVRPGQTSYSITAEFIGAPIPAVTRQFVLDYTLAYGPEPADVKTVDVQLTGMNPDDTVDPGKPLAIVVTAVDRRGRRFSTRKDEALQLPWSRLTIASENMKVDPVVGAVIPESDPVKIAGKTYRLTVSYGGLTTHTTSFLLKPQFYAWYRDRTYTSGEMVFVGEPGTGGGAGTPGRIGEPGQAGRPGGAGQRGPDVIVAATLVRTFDNLVDLIFVEVATQGKRQYLFRKPKDPPLKLISAGGAGGLGGAGGNGGAGTPGKGGAGGDGGAGGNGAPGGLGGDGGNIQLFLSRPDLQRHFILESRPGPGGPGGKPGDGGPGGHAGSSSAPNGRAGQQGLESQAGASGRAGQTSTMTGGPAADLNNNPPADFRSRLFFVNMRISPEQKVLAGQSAGKSAPAPR